MRRDEIKLKPCPFCGGNGHISTREIKFIGQNCLGAKKIRSGVQVICGRCKARGGLAVGEVIYGNWADQEKMLEPLRTVAIEAWNRRVEVQTG